MNVPGYVGHATIFLLSANYCVLFSSKVRVRIRIRFSVWLASGLLTRICMLTGQFADKPTRGQSSRGLDNSRTSQLADSEFLKIMELLYIICTLHLALTLTVTLSNIGNVHVSSVRNNT